MSKRYAVCVYTMQNMVSVRDVKARPRPTTVVTTNTQQAARALLAHTKLLDAAKAIRDAWYDEDPQAPLEEMIRAVLPLLNDGIRIAEEGE